MENEKREETQRLAGWKKTVLLINTVLAVVYYVWRAGWTINPDHQIYSWSFFAADLIGFTSSLLFMAAVWKIRKRETRPPRLKPSVDVYITTYNEPAEILRAAIYHCVKMDYPHTTFVLDDGRRPEIEVLARELGAEYITRPKNEHAKAGNLNFAMARTKGDLIAVFDADGVPHREFLTRLVGYFDDPGVALVQTPQSFYNLDSFQHINQVPSQVSAKRLWNEQSLFFDIIQCGWDFHDAGMWCGSGSLMRRSAIQKIGGVSCGTVTEDLHTTFNLHADGWRTVYHPEALAFALAPASVDPYVVQRARWALGSVQMLRKEWTRIFKSGPMTLFQRLFYFNSIYYVTCFQRAVYYFAPAFFLIGGFAPLVGPKWAVYPLVGNVILSLVNYYILARGTGRLMATEVFMLYTFWPYIKAVVTGLSGYVVPFKVTSKTPHAITPGGLLFPPALVALTSTAAFAAGVWRMLSLGFNVDWLVGTGFAGFYMIIGASALIQARRRPVSEEAYAFFDYRPVTIRQVNGLPVIGQNVAIAVAISEKMLQFIHVNEFTAGQKLRLELDLPDSTLELETEVTKCRKQAGTGENTLYNVELRYVALTAASKLELIRYFFEDATPRVFTMSQQEGRKVSKKVAEQRKVVRLPALLPAFVQDRAASTQPRNLTKGSVVGLVVELTAANARIKVPESLPVGSRIHIHIPWRKVSAEAQVARCSRESGQVNPPYDVGLVFAAEVAPTRENKISGDSVTLP